MTGERANVSTELVLLAPVLLLLAAFVVFAGRIGDARLAVVQATQQAARAASLVPTSGSAALTADTTARGNLDGTCGSVVVQTDATRLRPGGEVTVEVHCQVDLSGISFAGLPRTRTVSATATEVVDRYRGGP